MSMPITGYPSGVILSPPQLEALRYFAGDPGIYYPSEAYGRALRTMGLVSRARAAVEVIDDFGPAHRQARTLTELGERVLAEHLAAEAARTAPRTDTPRHLQLAMPTTSANGLTTVDGITSHLRPEGEQR